MKLFKNINKTKNRIVISIIIGLIGSISYMAILIYNGFEINEYNLFILFMLPGMLLKVFLLVAALTLGITTVYVLLKRDRSNAKWIQLILSMIVIFAVGIPEFQKTRSYDLYDSTKNENLNSTEVYNLYMKAAERDDVRAISSLAGHKNIADSLELLLSESEYMEVRRKIGWNSDSKTILIKLSSDNESEVRMAVASNKLTPLEIVDSLRNDSDEIVRNTAFAMYQARK